ncbi:MAG: hypothetical protein ACJ8AI_11880, partial [Rhodopila sp.]
ASWMNIAHGPFFPQPVKGGRVRRPSCTRQPKEREDIEMTKFLTEASKTRSYFDGSVFSENAEFTYKIQVLLKERVQFICDLAKSKRVLHIGCCDHHDVVKEKLASNNWLHSKRIKGLCGAKPPQKPRWTDAMGFGRSMIRYGDFTADTRCRGGLMCLSRRLARFATA